MDYTPINWEDFPNQGTPMNAYNLNHMDNQIKALSEAVVPIEANSEETTTEDLKKLKIGDINYKIPEGGGDLPNNIILQGGESEETTPIPRDADLLGGHEPSYYATKTDLANIGTVKIGDNICDVVRIRKQSQALKTETQFIDFTTDLTTAQINKSKIMCGNVYIIDQNGVGAFAMGSLAQKVDAVGVVTMAQSVAYYTILLTVFVAR